MRGMAVTSNLADGLKAKNVIAAQINPQCAHSGHSSYSYDSIAACIEVEASAARITLFESIKNHRTYWPICGYV